MEQPRKRIKTTYDLRLEQGLKQYYEDVKNFTEKKQRNIAKYDALIKEEVEAAMKIMRSYACAEWHNVLTHFHIPSHEAFPDKTDARYHQMPYVLDDSRYAPEELMRDLLTQLLDAPEHKKESYYLLSLRYGKPSERQRVIDLLRAQQHSDHAVECPFYALFRHSLIFTDMQYLKECS